MPSASDVKRSSLCGDQSTATITSTQDHDEQRGLLVAGNGRSAANSTRSSKSTRSEAADDGSTNCEHNRPANTFFASSLVDRNVASSSGCETTLTVDGIPIDPDDQVSTLVLSVERTMSLGEKKLQFPGAGWSRFFSTLVS